MKEGTFRERFRASAVWDYLMRRLRTVERRAVTNLHRIRNKYGVPRQLRRYRVRGRKVLICNSLSADFAELTPFCARKHFIIPFSDSATQYAYRGFEVSIINIYEELILFGAIFPQHARARVSIRVERYRSIGTIGPHRVRQRQNPPCWSPRTSICKSRQPLWSTIDGTAGSSPWACQRKRYPRNAIRASVRGYARCWLWS